jgi:DME family drug/metabolite transporter
VWSGQYSWSVFAGRSPVSLSPLAVGRVSVFLAAAMWSTNGVFIKEIDADATSITFFRCFFAALFLVPLVRFRRPPKVFDTVIGVAFFAALLWTFVASTKETTAANAIFLQYTAPFYVIALAPIILREQLRGIDLGAIAICLVGVGVLFGGNAGGGDVTGMALGLTSGLFFGLYMMWLRRMKYADSVLVTFIHSGAVALIFIAIPGVWDISGRDAALLALMAAVQFAIPYTLFARGVREVASAEASLIALVEPVMNPIWVVLIVGEEPTVATVIGGAIILTSLALRYTLFTRWAPPISEPGAVPEQPA